MLHHEDVLGSTGIDPRILNSALDGDEWSASYPFRLYTQGTSPRIGGSVVLRVSLEGLEKRNVRFSTENRTPAVQPIVTILT